MSLIRFLCLYNFEFDIEQANFFIEDIFDAQGKGISSQISYNFLNFCREDVGVNRIRAPIFLSFGNS